MNPPTLSIYWHLPVLIVTVCLIYSATRYETWDAILHEAVRWAVRMTLFLGSIGVTLYLIGWWLDAGASWWVLAAIAGAAVLLFGISFLPFSKKSSAVP
jgi:hypothetical protein